MATEKCGYGGNPQAFGTTPQPPCSKYRSKYDPCVGPASTHCYTCGLPLCSWCAMQCYDCGVDTCLVCAKMCMTSDHVETYLRCVECDATAKHDVLSHTCGDCSIHSCPAKENAWKEDWENGWDREWVECKACGKTAIGTKEVASWADGSNLNWGCGRKACPISDRYARPTVCDACLTKCPSCDFQYCPICWPQKLDVQWPCGGGHRHCRDCSGVESPCAMPPHTHGCGCGCGMVPVESLIFRTEGERAKVKAEADKWIASMRQPTPQRPKSRR